MLRLGLIGGLIFLLQAGGVILARHLGQQSPAPQTFLEVYHCPHPCWNNIRAGEHHPQAFWAVLQNVRNKGGWMYNGMASTHADNDDILYEFQLDLSPSPQVRLGDAIMIYGKPDAMRSVLTATLGGGGGARRPLLEVYFYWADGYLQLAAIPPYFREQQHLSPDMWVRQLHYRDPTSQPIMAEGLSSWRGFGLAATP